MVGGRGDGRRCSAGSGSGQGLVRSTRRDPATPRRARPSARARRGVATRRAWRARAGFASHRRTVDEPATAGGGLATTGDPDPEALAPSPQQLLDHLVHRRVACEALPCAESRTAADQVFRPMGDPLVVRQDVTAALAVQARVERAIATREQRPEQLAPSICRAPKIRERQRRLLRNPTADSTRVRVARSASSSPRTCSTRA